MTHGNHPPVPPPDGLAGHADLDTLADLDAGLLDAVTAARVDGHARSCPRCGAAFAALLAVRNDLRSLPPPVLPPAVAARLDATLADLRRGAGVSGSGGAHAMAATGDPGRAGPAGGTHLGGPPRRRPEVTDLAASRERRRVRARRMTSWAAASVVVAAALVGVGTALVRHDEGNDRLSSGAAIPGYGNEDSGGGQRATLGSVPGPSLPAPKAPEVGAPGDVGAASSSYSRQTLLTAIPKIVQTSAVDVIARAGLGGPGGALSVSERRVRCQAGIAPDGGRLVAVQRVSFEGQPAYVLVFDDGAGARTVVVVADDCGATTTPQVLFRDPA